MLTVYKGLIKLFVEWIGPGSDHYLWERQSPHRRKKSLFLDWKKIYKHIISDQIALGKYFLLIDVMKSNRIFRKYFLGTTYVVMSVTCATLHIHRVTNHLYCNYIPNTQIQYTYTKYRVTPWRMSTILLGNHVRIILTLTLAWFWGTTSRFSYWCRHLESQWIR